MAARTSDHANARNAVERATPAARPAERRIADFGGTTALASGLSRASHGRQRAVAVPPHWLWEDGRATLTHAARAASASLRARALERVEPRDPARQASSTRTRLVRAHAPDRARRQPTSSAIRSRLRRSPRRSRLCESHVAGLGGKTEARAPVGERQDHLVAISADEQRLARVGRRRYR